MAKTFKNDPNYVPTKVVRSDGVETTVYKGTSTRPCVSSRSSLSKTRIVDMTSTPELMFARQIADRFADAGIQVFLVGGAVRDHFGGKVIDDFDFSTPASVNEVKEVAGTIGAVWELGGEAHGTVAFNFGDEKIEVTTFRTEIYDGDRKNPIVEFDGVSMEQDLSRRDFTMNAMAINPLTGEVEDPFNGLNDFEEKILRTPGDPYDRFFEDPLRVDRAIRFCARDGFIMSEEVREAAEQIIAGGMLSKLSRERHTQEINKINARSGDSLADAMLLAEELGAFNEMFDAGITDVEDIAETVRNLEDPKNRIAALLLAGGDATRMKLPTEYRQLAAAVKGTESMLEAELGSGTEPDVASGLAMYQHGTKGIEYFNDLLNGTQVMSDALASSSKYCRESPGMLKGGSITEVGEQLGLKPGKWISDTKTSLDEAYIRSRGTLGKEEMLAMARTDLSAIA